MVRHLGLLAAIAIFLVHDAAASWQKINNSVTAFDMRSNGTGLIASSLTAPFLAKKTPTSFDGVIAMPSAITDVSIVDDNVAFMVVKDSGVYISSKKWTEWTKIDTASTSKFLLTTSFAIINQTARYTRFYYEGKFYNATGIDEPMLAIDHTSDSVLFGVSANKIYRSTNFGRVWQELYDFPERVGGSIYIDRSRNVIYVGGAVLHYSTTEGVVWDSIPKTGNGESTIGSVHGTPDCTGTFYVVSSSVPRPEILISRTQGEFFQVVGFNPGSTFMAPKKLLVFNRGNNLYWLDQSGDLYYSPDGADGSAVDSASFYVTIAPEANNLLRICREAFKSVNVSFGNVDCIPVIVDSLKQISGKGQLFADPGSFTIGGTSIGRQLKYYNNNGVIGWDTVRMRAHIRSTEGFRKEFIDFVVIVRTLSDPAELGISVSDVTFGEVKLNVEKSVPFSITNNGCDPLRIDSIRSSYPEIFQIVSAKPFPITLPKNGKADFTVKFKPTEEGPFLEALEIGTNGGHEFVSLYGIGAKTPSAVISEEDASIRAYPNPFTTLLNLENAKAGSVVLIYDLHGREVHRETIEGERTTLSLHNLNTGTYVMQIGSRRFKLIKE